MASLRVSVKRPGHPIDSGMHVIYTGSVSPIEIRRGGNIHRFHQGQPTAVPDELGVELCRQSSFRPVGTSAKNFSKTMPAGELTIGITTYPRSVDYLTNVCRHIAAASIVPTVVLAPTCLDDLPLCQAQRAVLGDRLEIMPPLCLMPKSGIEPGFRGLELNTDRLIAKLGDEHRHFLTLQDDVEFAYNGLERIAMIAAAANQIPHLGWISFYTPYSDCGASPRALWPYDPGRFYGELAMLWREDAAKAFLPHSDPGIPHDIMIQRWFVNKHYNCFGHSPCLVQHVGIESATGKSWLDCGKPRQTENFYPNIDSVHSAKPF